MQKNHRLRRWVGGALMLAAAGSSPADDTDIYLNTNPSGTDKPMIMFSLDYRASLGNTVCQDDEDTAADGACGLLVEEGYLDTDAIRESGNYSSLEVFRAILKKIMDYELTQGGPQIKDLALFGFMMNHANDNNCEPGDTGCSNGGFMLSKFRDLSVTTDYEYFFDALESIPIPNLTWNQVSSSSNQCNAYGSNTGEHQYQGAELFFEFFRYLTGQGIYFGQNGYTDFGTNGSANLDNGSDLLPTPSDSGNLTCRPTPVWDSGAEDPSSSGKYESPLLNLDPAGCGAQIYTFNFIFQVSNQEEDANCGILASRSNGGMDGIAGNTANCKVSSSGTGGTFSEVLKFLNDVDLGIAASGPNGAYGDVPEIPGLQNVTSFFFVPPTKVNTTTNAYANAGGTTSAIGMDLTDADATLKVLLDILVQVLSVSTTFVSPTLPSNVFNRTDLLDQVYIAIFKADQDLKPRWTGNLKRLHINTDDPTNPFLAGDDGAGGVSDLNAVADDGRISPSTLTVWSHPEDVPAPINPATSDFREGTDGRSTVHGGAGGNIPGYRLNYDPGTTNHVGATAESSGRIIFTEPDESSDPNLRPLNADNATAVAMLQIGDGSPVVASLPDDHKDIKIQLWRTLMPYPDCADYDAVLNPMPPTCANYNTALVADRSLAVGRLLDVLAYGRGYESLGGDRRDWFLGDPLHSRPVAINYGGASEANQEIRLAITTNDGFLHLFRESDGVEEWAFTPRSVTRIQHRLQANTVSVSPVHPYTVDSTPVVLRLDNNLNNIIEPATDRVYLYFGMRRGGKHYYALDITEPDDPKMLWSIGKSDPDFLELGQSWSEPTPIRVRYLDGGTEVEKHALIFGGGYNGDDDGDDVDVGKDARDDADPNFTGTDDDEGNAVFIVDAETGDLIWKATGVGSGITGPVVGDERLYYHEDMVDSIPANVTAVNATTTYDDYHDRAYVGDTGGVVWRIDFLSLDRSEWQVVRLANLGRHDTPGLQAHDRRFFHATDFVLSQDQYGIYDALVIASGNRPNPLSDSTENELYLIKDRNSYTVPVENTLSRIELQDLTDNCLQDGDASDCSGFDSATNTLPAMQYGWRIKLENCADQNATGTCGEKGLSQPLVLFGKILFNSYIPPVNQAGGPTCTSAEGDGQSYLIDLQDATALEDLNSANNTSGNIILDRSQRLDSGGIPSKPVVAGRFGATQQSPGTGGGGTGGAATCEDSIGVLHPDLDIELICSFPYVKKYWYTTEE